MESVLQTPRLIAGLMEMECTNLKEVLGRFEHREPRKSIAARLGISHSCVVSICSGKSWPELSRPWLISNDHGLAVGRGRRNILLTRSERELVVSPPKFKVTLDFAQEVLGRFEHGESRRSIATRFNVSHSCVTSICNGRRWPELPRPWLISNLRGLAVGRGSGKRKRESR